MNLQDQIRQQKEKLQSFNPSTSIHGYENLLKHHIHNAQLNPVDVEEWQEESKRIQHEEEQKTPWYQHVKELGSTPFLKLRKVESYELVSTRREIIDEILSIHDLRPVSDDECNQYGKNIEAKQKIANNVFKEVIGFDKSTLNKTDPDGRYCIVM